MRSVQRSGRGPALLNRNIWLVYLAYIAILWNLWFFSFWSVQIVREAADSSLLAAALTAAFNAGAGILGFPVGGWLAAVSPVVRPVLRWNHGRMMGGCVEGLRSRLVP